jgi:hypothetical protein
MDNAVLDLISPTGEAVYIFRADLIVCATPATNVTDVLVLMFASMQPVAIKDTPEARDKLGLPPAPLITGAFVPSLNRVRNN